MMVYVIHPFRGDGTLAAQMQNRLEIAWICRQLGKAGLCPISPVHAFGWLDEQRPADRDDALSYCLMLLRRCDEAWVFGAYQESEGCRHEIGVAEALGVPVIYCQRVPEAVR